jgi:hypothetical protein
MTVDELEIKLDAILKKMPSSGFDATADTIIAELGACTGCAEELGMKSCKQLLENLEAALKTRKTGGNTDESVQVRVTAMDFYVKKLQSGSTEDL